MHVVYNFIPIIYAAYKVEILVPRWPDKIWYKCTYKFTIVLKVYLNKRFENQKVLLVRSAKRHFSIAEEARKSKKNKWSKKENKHNWVKTVTD